MSLTWHTLEHHLVGHRHFRLVVAALLAFLMAALWARPVH
jgi:hypothetical protein